eukprot:2794198-Pyramimonas_sp.AAC.1
MQRHQGRPRAPWGRWSGGLVWALGFGTPQVQRDFVVKDDGGIAQEDEEDADWMTQAARALADFTKEDAKDKAKKGTELHRAKSRELCFAIENWLTKVRGPGVGTSYVDEYFKTDSPKVFEPRWPLPSPPPDRDWLWL